LNVKEKGRLGQNLGTSSCVLVVQYGSRRHGIHTGYLRMKIAGFRVMI